MCVCLTDAHIHLADAFDLGGQADRQGGSARRLPEFPYRPRRLDAACRRPKRIRSAGARYRPCRACWRFAWSSPFAAIVSCKASGSGISSAVTIQGPSTEYAIDGFAEAAVLRGTQRDVEADAIAGDVIERVGLHHRVAGFADDDRQFDFVVVAPVEEAQLDALRRADHRRGGLEEHPRGADIVDERLTGLLADTFCISAIWAR